MSTGHFLRLWRRLAKSERGSFSVEFALVSIVLVPLLLGVFQYAALIQQTMQLSQAARVGVEYAITYPSDTAGIEQSVANSSGMNTTGLAVSVNQFCECPDGTPVACTDTCSSGLQGNAYINVAVSQPARGPLQSAGFLSDSSVQTSATMRVR